MVNWDISDKPLEKGTLIKVYNCYRKFDSEETSRTPEVVGMYLNTGHEAQFEFYEVAVLKDENGKGGYIQNYLTSDFLLVPLPQEEKEGVEVYGSKEEV